jgi:hypothetical protein
MAEPLTSSDIWRIEAGWGTSPMASPEERKRFAAAGEIPLSSENITRLAEGRGISPMASSAEREAWKMGEYMTGRREQAPVEYGGIGDRPTGSSRRAMRMQAEWDYALGQQLEQQRALQQMEMQQRADTRAQRAQDLEIEKYKLAEDRDERVLNEAGAIVDSIRGSVAPDGTVISNPIRPDDDDAIERLEGLGRFKFGMENKSAQEMWSGLYNDALKFREEKIKQNEQNQLAAANLSARTGKPMREFGEYDEQGIFKPNLNAIVGASEQIKEQEAKSAEEKAIATETRRAEAQAGVTEEKSIASQEREIQREVRKATEDLRKLNASLAGRSSLSETQRSSLQAAKDSLLDKQIDKAALRGFVFDDQEGFKKARDEGKIPSGTRAFIGRTAIDIP